MIDEETPNDVISSIRRGVFNWLEPLNVVSIINFHPCLLNPSFIQIDESLIKYMLFKKRPESLHISMKFVCQNTKRENSRFFDIESFNWRNETSVQELLQEIPQFFDPELFNWKDHSNLIIQERPEFFNPDLFNWENFSWMILSYSDKNFPNFINRKLFNWEKYSHLVLNYNAELFLNEEFNWLEDSGQIAMRYQRFFDPDRFNWKDNSEFVIRYCPQFFDPELFNWRDFSSSIILHLPFEFNPYLFNWNDHLASILDPKESFGYSVKLNKEGYQFVIEKSIDYFESIELKDTDDLLILEQLKKIKEFEDVKNFRFE